jgi:hypothetical protein
MKKRELLAVEMLLILAGVFIFRGLWTLLDRIPVMDSPAALWASLLLGCTVSVWALRKLMKQDKEEE